MRIPRPGKAGVVALMACGLFLSGCATDGYGRSWGSVSVGSGWYDDYYPGYYGYDYGYWGYPGYYSWPGYYSRPGHFSRPGSKFHRRWKDRPPVSGHWQGRPDKHDGKKWRGKDRSPHRDRWQGRGDRPRSGGWEGPPRRADGGEVRSARPDRGNRAARIEAWRAGRGDVARPSPRQRGGGDRR